jgi:hypothetical protein
MANFTLIAQPRYCLIHWISLAASHVLYPFGWPVLLLLLLRLVSVGNDMSIRVRRTSHSGGLSLDLSFLKAELRGYDVPEFWQG